ncbi:undecaprenyl-diphosphatase [Roseivirga ehrenbergii]|uniref:Undecaprenyl-diphosphatase n=4 Tax=Roseivirga TaxID=290180 RepID=A0A150WZZ7_ROSEK|nr:MULTISPECIES: undecaprenyl-diphosphate phosphatase [Roseivirga]KYG72059.1 UDP-diphosphatase [Roseivirga ehrenbergii]KYG80848.1 UDP-diphosphatase [Roseivirga seohaensis]TCL13282.1 undecaprenyl-diphosphatase [Roseivirga ehrenbergii]
MTIIESIILGIVQGLTEFLPVSSSGHLEIVKAILGDTSVPEESLLMTVVLHAATALSTIVIFRKEIGELVMGLFQFKNNDQFKYSLKIVASMIPAAVIGVLFDEEIESLFGGQLLLVGCMLILTAGLLFLADKAKKTDKAVSMPNAITIGIAQAIAILPGISRSGATISTAVLLGIDREKAARFSFLMVVPLILGKVAKDMLSGDIASSQIESASLIVGFLAAFLAGLVACKWMIALVKKSQLKYFSFYCFAVGLGAIIYTFI